ncbi:MAG TPA: hypothetical protein VEZ47_04535 [Gemmatirosa sp.]|nr:hypothetical protein [Gemmatirosa sp.]
MIHDPAFALRAAEWHADDPDLPLVQRMLDVLQRVESAGWVELGDACLRGLLVLLPDLHTSTDARPAFVLSNRGRALRFLGQHDQSRYAFEAAQQCARRVGEEWLEYRCELGLAVLAEVRGNIPAARAGYLRVLARYDDRSPISRGARQGLLSVARTAKRYDEAFDHAWHAFREAGDDRELRIDALTQLGDLCRLVGRHKAALRACEAALALGPPARYVAPLHGTSMQASEALGQYSRADAHVAVIMKLLPETGYDTYSNAVVWRDLAWWHASRDEVFGGGHGEQARRCAHEAQTLAARHGYHEIAFEIDDLIARLNGALVTSPATTPTLGSDTERIVSNVAALPLTGELLLTLG